ncbi:MAG: hypothetical protein JXA13_01255 [Anaerolineales bacterium]|nr:hypothetical protein [Anaerolineales bacterium]
MKLTPPKQVTFWISIALVVVGVIAHIIAIPVLAVFDFWLVVIGAVVLVLGLLLKGF